MVATAQANTYCVHNVANLIAALADAGGGGTHDGQANTIHVKSGTFTTSGAAFTFGTTSGAALTIDGGWDDACAVQDPTPGATALDGGGSTQVLSIGTNGDLTVQHLTIRNGYYTGSAGSGAAIALNGPNATAVAIFDGNVVRDNAGTAAAVGTGMSIIGNGTVYLENSLFTGNSGPSVTALLVNLTTGTAYLMNNTIADNTNTQSNQAITSIGSSTATGYVSNTISYGNQGMGVDDFFLVASGNVTFVHDDYTSISGGTVAGGSTGNFIAVDPRFVGAGDLHLRDTSPLLGAGTITPAGGLPAEDLEGNPRSIGGKVDLGAYENVDVIFASDFETP